MTAQSAGTGCSNPHHVKLVLMDISISMMAGYEARRIHNQKENYPHGQASKKEKMGNKKIREKKENKKGRRGAPSA